MICPNCGRNVPDGTQCPCMGSTPLLSSNPAVNVIKTVGSSTQFLVLAVLYSVAVLLSFVAAATTNNALDTLAYSAYEYGVDPSVLYPLMDQDYLSTVLSAVFSAVPGILIAAALWRHYASSRSTVTGGVSTAGLTICKVLLIISLVVTGLGILGLLLLLILAFVGVASSLGNANSFAYGYGDPEAIVAGAAMIIVVVAIVLLVLLVFNLIYGIAAVKTVNCLKNVIHTGIPDNRISRLLIVMCYILGVASVIGGLFSLFSSPLLGIASFVSAAASILMARILSECRSRMTMLLYPPVQPVYVQPPQSPAYGQTPYGYGQPQPLQPYQAVPQAPVPEQPPQATEEPESSPAAREEKPEE